MATIYGDTHADPGVLRGKTIAVIGYGSQGQAQALNLRDSGVPVVVGLRSGSAAWTRAEVDGVEVREISDAARYADLVVLLVPDEQHRAVYERGIGPHLGRGRTLLVAHGSSVHTGQLRPAAEVDVAMVVPCAPGERMRALFREGRGVPALLAIHQDATGRAEATALAYAQAIGCTRAGVRRTTFAEEVETDWPSVTHSWAS